MPQEQRLDQLKPGEDLVALEQAFDNLDLGGATAAEPEAKAEEPAAEEAPAEAEEPAAEEAEAAPAEAEEADEEKAE